MSDNNAILEFSENLEKKARMRSELAEKVKRFAEIEQGTVIIKTISCLPAAQEGAALMIVRL